MLQRAVQALCRLCCSAQRKESRHQACRGAPKQTHRLAQGATLSGTPPSAQDTTSCSSGRCHCPELRKPGGTTTSEQYLYSCRFLSLQQVQGELVLAAALWFADRVVCMLARGDTPKWQCSCSFLSRQ